MADKTYQLIMQRGPHQGQVFTLLSRTTTIGRDPMADVVIVDPEVSRQHVRLFLTDDGYQIQDLGSTNGTFINGQRLAGDKRLLQPGQEILLGSSVTLLYLESPGSTSALDEMPLADDAPEPAQPQASPEQLAVTGELPEEPPPPPTVQPPPVSPLAESDSLTADSPTDHDAQYAADIPPDPDIAAKPDDEAEQDELAAEIPALAGAPAVSSTIDEPAARSTPPPTFAAKPVNVPSPPTRYAPPSTPEPAPLVPPGDSTRSDKRRRTITWVIAALLLLMLCCCAFVLSAWFIWGDPLMEALGVY